MSSAHSETKTVAAPIKPPDAPAVAQSIPPSGLLESVGNTCSTGQEGVTSHRETKCPAMGLAHNSAHAPSSCRGPTRLLDRTAVPALSLYSGQARRARWHEALATALVPLGSAPVLHESVQERHARSALGKRATPELWSPTQLAAVRARRAAAFQAAQRVRHHRSSAPDEHCFVLHDAVRTGFGATVCRSMH
jgi:hypothetical protein